MEKKKNIFRSWLNEEVVKFTSEIRIGGCFVSWIRLLILLHVGVTEGVKRIKESGHTWLDVELCETWVTFSKILIYGGQALRTTTADGDSRGTYEKRF